MRKILRALFLIVSLSYVSSTNAQFVTGKILKETTDSIKYYKKILYSIYKQTWDSLQQSESVKSAKNRLRQYELKSNGYTSFTIYGDVAHADYDHLNNGIAQSGFPAMNGPQYRVGVGISHEYHDQWMFEFYFGTLGIPNKVKIRDESIKCSFNNALQLNFGYDLIKSSKINIYPYSGLAMRFTDLTYTRPAKLNNNYSSIADLIQNDISTSGEKYNLSYQAGIGFDFVIHENKQGDGTMLFLKAGTDGIFGSSSFKIHGASYDPQINQGAWIVTFGLKFFSRD